MSSTVPIRRPQRRILLSAALGLALGTGFVALPAAAATEAPVAHIRSEPFTLPHRLAVVVHAARKAPIVAGNTSYHVGSRAEPAGRSGFAHLFEPMMFQRSENHDREFFYPFRAVCATDQ